MGGIVVVQATSHQARVLLAQSFSKEIALQRAMEGAGTSSAWPSSEDPAASRGYANLGAPSPTASGLEPMPVLRLQSAPTSGSARGPAVFSAMHEATPGVMTRARFRAELQRLAPQLTSAAGPAQIEELFLSYRGYLQQTRRSASPSASGGGTEAGAGTSGRPPVLGKDLASIDTLANGYLDPRHDKDGDGAIDLATEAEGSFVRSDGVTVRSSILAMATAADQLGNRDGKVTAQEYRGFLSQFDTGDTNSRAGDGFLSGRELDAWEATKLLPTVRL